jgi:hypothetical protein
MYMNSTPIQPSDLLNEGAYVGNIMDFINDEEYNHQSDFYPLNFLP